MDALDLVAFAPHPDDAELLCGGTLALMSERGYRTGIVDLTRGELGTRGTPEQRAQESAAAALVLGLAHRESLGLPDGCVADTDEQRRIVVAAIRRLRPEVVILPYPSGRHPDHVAASALVRSASFLAGLANYAPGESRPGKPRKLLYASAYRDHDSRPDFVVDITPAIERKLTAVRCYGSQFDGRDEGGELFPTGRDFYTSVEQRAAHYGSLIQVAYGEPFVTLEPVAIEDVVTLRVASI
jgi:bacillithiol biosynthesis deacetylase BshB1